VDLHLVGGPDAAVLSGLVNEISETESERVKWASRLESGQREERVQARAWLAELSDEITSFNEKRELLERELAPIRDMLARRRPKPTTRRGNSRHSS
jgi:hypothetical protein